MPIEFDAAKRTATLGARGLDMARAEEVLAGVTLTVEDDRQDYGEDRIISMRKANERERALYGPRF